MYIALCDDEKIFTDDLKHIIDKISFQYDIDLHIDTFSCGEELVNYIIQNNKSYDLIFLDILMKELNGIETSRKIRRVDDKVEIVFLTSTIEFAIEGYEVKALNYLIKPIDFEKVKNIILDLYENDKNNIYSFKVNQTLYKIDLDEVNYFEVDNRVIHIRTKKNNFMKNLGFYKKLDDLELELSEFNFVRCHRSYLINLKNIQSISTKEVQFLNGDTCFISRRHFKDLKEKFSTYLERSLV